MEYFFPARCRYRETIECEERVPRINIPVQYIGFCLLEVYRGAAEVLREASPVSFHQPKVVVRLRRVLRRREGVPLGG